MKKFKLKPCTGCTHSKCIAQLCTAHSSCSCSYLQAGALLTEFRGVPNIYDGDITFLGHVMAKLPVDIHIAKLILLGHIFSVLEECIIMGN